MSMDVKMMSKQQSNYVPSDGPVRKATVNYMDLAI